MSQSATRFGQRVRRAARHQRPHLAARAQRRAHGAAPVGHPPARVDPGAPAGDRPDRQLQPRDRPPRRRLLGRRHLLEVHRLQPLVGREGELARRTRPPRPPPPLAPAAPRRRRAAPRPRAAPPAVGSGGSFSPRTSGVSSAIMCSRNCGSRQNSRNTWAKTSRCSGPADEAGLQRVVEVAPVGEARRLDRADRVEHPAGADRQPRLAQRAGEVGDVARELAVLGNGRAAKPPCATAARSGRDGCRGSRSVA